MKRLPRSLVWLGAVCAVAAITQQLAGHALARGDVVEAAIMRSDVWLLVAAFVLLAARIFLYFLAPAWALYIAFSLGLRPVLAVIQRSTSRVRR